MKLIELPGIFEVRRYPPGTPLAPPPASDLFCLTHTRDETSVICRAGEGIPSERVESGWRCFKVAGTLDFALTGILASIATPLAAAKISIFALSTFDTDYVLVKSEHFAAAKAALTAAGFAFVS